MYFKNPNLTEVSNYITNSNWVNNKSFLVLLGEDCQISCKEIVSLMNKNNISFIGGVFPYVIFNDELSSEGLIIKHTHYDIKPIYFDSQEIFSSQIVDYDIGKFETAFVFTTGLSETVSEHLATLYTHLGNDLKYFGAGVGRAKTTNQGLLFSNEGVYNTGTIVVLSKFNPQIDHQHGWNKLIGPFLVTKSEKNIIKEINWENSFKIYQQLLKENLNINLNIDNYESIAIHYPFGFFKEEKGYIVRDPFDITNNGYLKCVGNIPENSLVDILCNNKVNNHTLPEKIVENCKKNKVAKLKDVLLFDCISRAKHLDKDFKSEICNIYNYIKRIEPSMNIEGALTFGEICSNKDGYLELLNKSIALGCIYDN